MPPTFTAVLGDRADARSTGHALLPVRTLAPGAPDGPMPSGGSATHAAPPSRDGPGGSHWGEPDRRRSSLSPGPSDWPASGRLVFQPTPDRRSPALHNPRNGSDQAASKLGDSGGVRGRPALTLL